MAKILIIEDSKSQAAIIAEVVKNAGHEPVIFSDIGPGLVRSALALNPDIILLDLILLGPDGKPGADGFQICREFKKLSNDQARVVVVSAKGDEDSAEWALMQGADAFLQKPFAVQDLVGVLKQMIQS